ncbi:MAG: hypothetical protein AMXMBFR33_35190 [Candidatus Xenobia bacterium]
MNVTGLPTARKKWTILYYMDGKNNLSKMIERSASSLEKVGSDPNVNLVAEIGLAGMDEVKRGELVKGQGLAELHSIGSQDMGSASTVQDFVEWGMQRYPAERYAVVLSNHGAGFQGVLNDDEYGSVVQNEDLAQALEAAQRNTGQKIEVVAFDACLMAQAEVGYALRNSAKYMVASEEVEAGFMLPVPGMNGGMPLRKIAEELQQVQGDLTGEELSRLFVYEAGRQVGRSNFTPTQSAIDLKRMGDVRQASEDLAGRLLQAMSGDSSVKGRLRAVMSATQSYTECAGTVDPFKDYRDLGDFSRRLCKAFPDQPGVTAAAQRLQRELVGAVIAESHSVTASGTSMFGSTGLSVYLPTHFQDNFGYSRTDFARGSQWLRMLRVMSEPETGFSLPNANAGPLKLMRSIGRLELPFVAAMGGLGPVGPVVALMAGVDSVYRLKGGVEKVSEGIEGFGRKGTTAMLAEGALETTTGALTGAAAVSYLLGNHTAAAGLGLLSLGLELSAGAVKLGGALVRKAVDSTRSVEDKVAATRESGFAPSLEPAVAPPGGQLARAA